MDLNMGMLMKVVNVDILAFFVLERGMEIGLQFFNVDMY
jgi:hypothetical protein